MHVNLILFGSIWQPRGAISLLANLTTPFDRRQVHMCPYSPSLLYLTAYSRKKTRETTDWMVYLCFPECSLKIFVFFVFFVFFVILSYRSRLWIPFGKLFPYYIPWFLSAWIGPMSVLAVSVWCHVAQILPSKSRNFGAFDTGRKKFTLYHFVSLYC